MPAPGPAPVPSQGARERPRDAPTEVNDGGAPGEAVGPGLRATSLRFRGMLSERVPRYLAFDEGFNLPRTPEG